MSDIVTMWRVKRSKEVPHRNNLFILLSYVRIVSALFYKNVLSELSLMETRTNRLSHRAHQRSQTYRVFLMLIVEVVKSQ